MYSGILEILDRYWKAYGGVKALITSGYFHLSILLLALTFPFWLHQAWWNQPISIIPNLLGFSLGGLAMLISFGDEEFKRIIAQKSENSKVSAYVSLVASFVHFILLQLLALLYAVVRNALNFEYSWPSALTAAIKVATACFSGLGYLIFLYSLTSMIAAVFAIFRVTGWYELFKNNRP